MDFLQSQALTGPGLRNSKRLREGMNTNQNTMDAPITLKAESFQFKDLEQGYPLQVRTTVPSHKLRKLQKGSTVHVVHDNGALNAVLIDDPILITEGLEGDNTEVSIELLKSTEA